MESNFSLSDVSALMNGNGCNGNQWNNPMWLLWALLFGFGGGGYGYGRNAQGLQDSEIMSQINGLRSQIADNQNTNNLSSAIYGNHDLLHGINGAMNLGFAGVNSAINGASTANLMANKDLQSAMQNCCCDIKTNILSGNNGLMSRIDQLANGVTQGFSAVAYANQQQTNELTNAINGSSQRILDKMCADTTQSLRDRLLEASQTAQTATIINALKPATTTGG